MNKIFGIYQLESGEYKDCSEKELQFENECVHLILHGHILHDGRRDELSSIADLYIQNGLKITEKLCGLYILVIYDKRKKKLVIFHDRTTSPVTLYYLKGHEELLISTSLKTLLNHSFQERKMNESAIETFLINGFVYGKETLVDGVYKIAPYCGLVAEKGEVRQVSATYRSSDYSKGQALDQFKPVLDHAIEKAIKDEAEINLPLSSGYDSNYIAYMASGYGNKKINAFSVGGKFGKNEIPLVEKNLPYFSNTNLTKTLTTFETLKSLPDIVERLEGSVFEVGIFLQYELMKLVHEKEKDVLICGECADQVFNPYFFRNDRIEQTDEKDKYYEFSEYPYIFGTQLILKKSGIMANSFGIETHYPYLDDDVVALSEPLGEINGKDKRCHVANCKECLPEEVLRNIAKQGGATDCHSLFENEAAIKMFFNQIERTDFFMKHEELIKGHSYEEKEKQTGLALVKTNLRNFVLRVLHVGTESRKQQLRFMEEMKLREYLCIAYLVEFEQKFILNNAVEEGASIDGRYHEV